MTPEERHGDANSTTQLTPMTPEGAPSTYEEFKAAQRRADAYFASTVNPTVAELEAWAYSGETWPDEEDFDLFVMPLPVAFLARLAADPGCAQRDFFLRCLYHRVGDIYRDGRHDDAQRDAAMEVLAAVPSSEDPRLETWRRDCSKLIRGEIAWSSNDWCGGALVTRRLKEIAARP